MTIHAEWLRIKEATSSLKEQYHALKTLSARKRGKALEQFIKQLLREEGIAYWTSGEEFEGTFEWQGRPFLVTTKWLKEPVPLAKVATFRAKVAQKPKGTWGIFISLGGYSKSCLRESQSSSQHLLLFDQEDIEAVGRGVSSFLNILRAKLAVAYQRGESYFVPWPKETHGACSKVVPGVIYEAVFLFEVEGGESPPPELYPFTIPIKPEYLIEDKEKGLLIANAAASEVITQLVDDKGRLLTRLSKTIVRPAYYQKDYTRPLSGMSISKYVNPTEPVALEN